MWDVLLGVLAFTVLHANVWLAVWGWSSHRRSRWIGEGLGPHALLDEIERSR